MDRAAGGVLVRYGYPFRSIGLLLRGAEHHAVALEAGEIPRLQITEHHDVPDEKRIQRVVLPQARGDQPRCLRRRGARSVRSRQNGTAHISGRMDHCGTKVNPQRPAQHSTQPCERRATERIGEIDVRPGLRSVGWRAPLRPHRSLRRRACPTRDGATPAQDAPLCPVGFPPRFAATVNTVRQAIALLMRPTRKSSLVTAGWSACMPSK